MKMKVSINNSLKSSIKTTTKLTNFSQQANSTQNDHIHDPTKTIRSHGEENDNFRV